MGIASTLIVLACVLFIGGFPQDEHVVSTAGWLIGPVAWLFISAYRKWKCIPNSDKKAPDLKKSRIIAVTAFALSLAAVAFTALAVAIQIIQIQL